MLKKTKGDNILGNYYKIVPTPPYRQNNIEKALKEDLFLFDSRYMVKNGNYTYAYGISNKVIGLPFNGKIISDYNGNCEYKEIGLCYDVYGNVLNYILPNTFVLLCIENLNEISSKYGFTVFDKKEMI